MGGKMLNITCRYSEILDKLLEHMGAVKVLRLESDCSYQGSVDTDVLLSNGRIFSYQYSYGSCSGCDTWEAKGYSDEQIMEDMKQGATEFSKEEYIVWIAKKMLTNPDDEDLKRMFDIKQLD
jgi:hypothetical protein